MKIKTKILSVIPARGGSKALPKKNIMQLSGKPLISWTIDAAMKSKYLAKTIVSTDCDEIKKIALHGGAEVPFVRPKQFSTDSASSMSVIKHAVNFLSCKGESYDLVVMLQPTSPLRDSSDIDNAISIYLENYGREETTLVSGFKINEKYNWVLKQNNKKVKFVNPDLPSSYRRQELASLFLPNGAIFIANTKNLPEAFYTSDTLMYEMSKEKSIDIDTIEDYYAAKRYIEGGGGGSSS